MSDLNNMLDSDFIEKSPKKHKISVALFITFSLVALLGMMFRIMHWPFAIQLLLFGAGGLTGYLVAKTIFIPKHKVIILIPIAVALFTVYKYQPYETILALYAGMTIISFAFFFLRGLRINKYNKSINKG